MSAQHPIFGATPRGKKRRECFILMPFKTNWSMDTWHCIRSALDRYGVVSYRADELYGQIIIEDVWKSISSARIIVADVTGKNPNVFYELGIAHTLGSDVILLTQSTRDIPFDVNRFRHILYTSSRKGYRKLKRQLVDALKEKRVLAAPLPSKPVIRVLDRQLRKNDERFLGMWEGRWTGLKRGSLTHILVVRNLRRAKADVIYAWGSSKEWKVREGYSYLTGTLQRDTLRLQWPGVQIEYRLAGPNTVRATRVDLEGTFHATMRRLNDYRSKRG